MTFSPPSRLTGLLMGAEMSYDALQDRADPSYSSIFQQEYDLTTAENRCAPR